MPQGIVETISNVIGGGSSFNINHVCDFKEITANTYNFYPVLHLLAVVFLLIYANTYSIFLCDYVCFVASYECGIKTLSKGNYYKKRVTESG